MSDRHAVNVTIRNRLGFHARPAMAFADLANAHKCDVSITRGDESVDGKSIMEIMLLAATKGTELTVVCEGEDAADCIAKLKSLVDRGFDEE